MFNEANSPSLPERQQSIDFGQKKYADISTSTKPKQETAGTQ